MKKQQNTGKSENKEYLNLCISAGSLKVTKENFRKDSLS